MSRPKHSWWEVRYGNLRFPLHKVEVQRAYPGGALHLFESPEGDKGPYSTTIDVYDDDGELVRSYRRTWIEARQALADAYAERVRRAQKSAAWWQHRYAYAVALRETRYREELDA